MSVCGLMHGNKRHEERLEMFGVLVDMSSIVNLPPDLTLCLVILTLTCIFILIVDPLYSDSMG